MLLGVDERLRLLVIAHLAKESHKLVHRERRQDCPVVHGRSDDLVLSSLHSNQLLIHCVFDDEACDVGLLCLADAEDATESCSKSIVSSVVGNHNAYLVAQCNY